MRENFRFLTMVKLVLTVAVVAAVSCCSSALGQFGTGPALIAPSGIAVEASGDLVVADSALDAVVQVDPMTGDRTYLGAPPPNDDWIDSINFADPNFAVNGINLNATTQADEQQLANTGSTVWWNFHADSDGMVTINTFGSDFDTQLHIYTGVELGFPNLIPVANNDDVYPMLQSKVAFAVTAGECYDVRVGGHTEGGPAFEGNIVLNGTFFILGDANGDGEFNNLDIAAFVLAATNGVAYQAMFPDVDPDVVLDMNGDGGFNNLDFAWFVGILTGLI